MPWTETPPSERVPISVIAPLIENWLKKYRLHAGAQGKVDGYVTAKPGGEGHLQVLAFQTGVSGRTLRRLLAGQMPYGDTRYGTKRMVDYVSFNLADKIVCATVGPFAWLEEPLSAYYGPFDVSYSEAIKGYELPDGVSAESFAPKVASMWRAARKRLMEENDFQVSFAA